MKSNLSVIDPAITLVDFSPTKEKLQIMKKFREKMQKIINENKIGLVLLNRKN